MTHTPEQRFRESAHAAGYGRDAVRDLGRAYTALSAAPMRTVVAEAPERRFVALGLRDAPRRTTFVLGTLN